MFCSRIVLCGRDAREMEQSGLGVKVSAQFRRTQQWEKVPTSNFLLLKLPSSGFTLSSLNYGGLFDGQLGSVAASASNPRGVQIFTILLSVSTLDYCNNFTCKINVKVCHRIWWFVSPVPEILKLKGCPIMDTPDTPQMPSLIWLAIFLKSCAQYHSFLTDSFKCIIVQL